MQTVIDVLMPLGLLLVAILAASERIATRGPEIPENRPQRGQERLDLRMSVRNSAQNVGRVLMLETSTPQLVTNNPNVNHLHHPFSCRARAVLDTSTEDRVALLSSLGAYPQLSHAGQSIETHATGG